jgi:selenide, water dikinase
LQDDLALVQSVDFLTPIVDDPYRFGQIAAANAFSDLYAVGATPLLALNIASFPGDVLPPSVLAAILRGGADTARRAGATIVGGHTIDDEEPKYGLAVTGTVRPDRFISPRGAVPGDLLVLTKPIGSGTIATALKAGEARDHDLEASARWMLQLNDVGSQAMQMAGAHAATDVSGFGLLAHLADICRMSSVSASLDASAVPLLPGALQYVRREFVPKGTRTNLTAVQGVVFAGGVDDDMRLLLADPQTSGGLLVALPPEALDEFRGQLAGDRLAAVIGVVGEGPAGHIVVYPHRDDALRH